MNKLVEYNKKRNFNSTPEPAGNVENNKNKSLKNNKKIKQNKELNINLKNNKNSKNIKNNTKNIKKIDKNAKKSLNFEKINNSNYKLKDKQNNNQTKKINENQIEKIKNKQLNSIKNINSYTSNINNKKSKIINKDKNLLKNKKQKNKIFVIQYHRAKKEHYDFRLEHKGVLISFAVPKGLSLNPKVKHLAVHVEDHPISYANFSGIIPKVNYGAGTVEIFDSGYYNALINFDIGLKKGHLKFELFGEKFKGEWSLVKIDEKNWLIIKSEDKFASKKEQIAKPKKNLLKKVEPMLAFLTNQIPTGKDWIFEIKYDGYRILSYVEDNKIKLYSRNYTDYSIKFKEICNSLLKHTKNTSMILDGEVVYFDQDGRSDFGLLQHKIKTKSTGYCYVIFDILAFNGEDLRDKPLIERKEILEQVLTNCPKNLIFSSFVKGKGKQSFNLAKKLNLEGIIAKNINSKYVGLRNGDWLKIKCIKRQEFVIGGYTISDKNDILSSILVGYYDKDKLVYIGKVGTGFNEKIKKKLVNKFKKIKNKEKPFKELKENDAIWLTPSLVAEIKFTEITQHGNLRHPVYIGLREDKDPKNVKLEKENE